MDVRETDGLITAAGHAFSTERGALQRLALDIAPPRLAALEVGTHAGVSARILAPLFSRYVCVDPYETGYDPGDAASEVERSIVARCVFDKYIWPNLPNVRLLLEPSPGAAKYFADGEFDLVYIDACHTLLSVRADIAAWWPKVRAGGVLAGHDFTARFPGVQEAVRERFGEPRYYSGGHWCVRKGDQSIS